MAWVMMAKYTPPTRRVNIAKPITKASKTGTPITAINVNEKLWNGSQNHGSSVSWFQSMKSGMPGVDWIAVASGVEASSFRNIAMQYPPRPKNTPWPRLRMPALPQHITSPIATKAYVRYLPTMFSRNGSRASGRMTTSRHASAR